ncbi:ribosome biogenesis GTPase [Elusimicrobium posterum]|uniref:ribosome small subunit-dependent GTPase A n=1 Tax=Elusimicrobium posterum TaxID=3116653 RepID=UPI003C7968BA
MSTINLEKLGFNGRFAAQSYQYEGLFPGRVSSQYKDLYKIICENGEITAGISGKLRFEAQAPSDFPAVGDFVMIDRITTQNGNAVIHHVLSRKSAFIRRAAGTSNGGQVVAANIDTLFICMSLNNDFNLRRLERYLAIAWDSGAMPVIVLTKADLCEDAQEKLREAEAAAPGAEVLLTSAITEGGYKQVLQYIKEGQTGAFIGSSGAGKSTLINCLAGGEILATSGLRNDDKGRHTTTRRELIVLENGGMVIDTPGMRELGLESADLSKAFADIDALSGGCKFGDCMHESEPGCAVQKALSEGIIDSERFLSYKKLKKEARYEGLNSREIENIKINEMFAEVGGMKNARKFAKEKNKKRNL